MAWGGDKHCRVICVRWIHASIVSLLNVWMNRFVGKVKAKRFILALVDKLNRVVRQDVCHVAGGLKRATVYVQVGIGTLTLPRKLTHRSKPGREESSLPMCHLPTNAVA